MNQISQIPRARQQVAKPRDGVFKVVIICNCDSPDYDRVYCRPTNIRPRYSAIIGQTDSPSPVKYKYSRTKRTKMSLSGASMAIYKEDSSSHQRLCWYLMAGPEGLRSVAQNSLYEAVIGQIIRAFCWILASPSASERNYAYFSFKIRFRSQRIGEVRRSSEI
jgi:hypothetical protein